MKHLLSLLLVFTLAGCASINIPSYVQDKNAHKKVFYSSYDEVHDATTNALGDLGWKIEAETDPALYEREREAHGSR